jgi:hypothetical protein
MWRLYAWRMATLVYGGENAVGAARQWGQAGVNLVRGDVGAVPAPARSTGRRLSGAIASLASSIARAPLRSAGRASRSST